MMMVRNRKEKRPKWEDRLEREGSGSGAAVTELQLAAHAELKMARLLAVKGPPDLCSSSTFRQSHTRNLRRGISITQEKEQRLSRQPDQHQVGNARPHPHCTTRLDWAKTKASSLSKQAGQVGVSACEHRDISFQGSHFLTFAFVSSLPTILTSLLLPRHLLDLSHSPPPSSSTARRISQ